MSTLVAALKEILGLFVDDGSLAIGIIALVTAVAALAHFGLAAGLIGPLLFLGCATLLIENVLRTLRGKGR